MAFDGIVAKKIVDELNSLVDYKIDKIYQPDKNTVIIGLYGNFTNLALLACISPSNYRIHLTTHLIKNPEVAPNFCMFLRKHILGYKIEKIYSKDFERIVYIDLVNSENPDKPIKKVLIVELMGKHSNIILTNNSGIILDSIRHTSTEENAQRDIYPTARYIAPLKNNYNFENSENYKYINEKYLSIRSENNSSKNYNLILSEEEKPFSLNFALDDFYFSKESNELFLTFRNNISNMLLSALKKYEKRLENIDNKLLECKDMDKYKLYGELITANLYKIPNYNISSISLENYYDENKKIEIPLDKKYSPQYNANKYFKKYSKLKNALEIVNVQKQETLQELKYIESIIYELENCRTINDVQEVYDEISENKIFENVFKSNRKNLSKNSKSPKKSKKLTSNKFSSFNPLKYNIDGYIIYVGRNNKENDYLTNKFASKNDIWFHTKEIHGSHVILKTKEKETIPESIIYEAARLAANHSKAKNSSNVPVDYCKVSFVKKVPGNKPGLVIYKNNKTIYV